MRSTTTGPRKIDVTAQHILIFDFSLQIRAAGCIWLLSLVSFTGRHPRLLPLLPDIQDAFSNLLGDGNELTQEMASRGMSVVYSMGDEESRKELLASLVGTLQGSFCKPKHGCPFFGWRLLCFILIKKEKRMVVVHPMRMPEPGFDPGTSGKRPTMLPLRLSELFVVDIVFSCSI